MRQSNKDNKTEHIMYAVEPAQADDHLEIQMGVMCPHLMEARMIAAVMENRYLFDAGVVANQYLRADYEVVGPES